LSLTQLVKKALHFTNRENGLSSRLRVYENRIMRGMFGFKWDEVTAECRKWYNVENHGLHSVTYYWDGNYTENGTCGHEWSAAYRGLEGIPQRKR
jgi:hypothetical protein